MGDTGHKTSHGRVRWGSALTWVAAAACLVLFIALAATLRHGGILPVDRVAMAVVAPLRAPVLTSVQLAISGLVTPASIVAYIVLIGVFSRSGRVCALFATNSALAALLNLVLKELVARPRPDPSWRLAVEGGYSFPSGHAMAAMAFFGLVIWYAHRAYPSGAVRRVVTAACVAAIALVGASRIYLGVHYASDVLAGFAVSYLWLVCFTRTQRLWTGRVHGAPAGVPTANHNI